MRRSTEKKKGSRAEQGFLFDLERETSHALER